MNHKIIKSTKLKGSYLSIYECSCGKKATNSFINRHINKANKLEKSVLNPKVMYCARCKDVHYTKTTANFITCGNCFKPLANKRELKDAV